MEGIESSNSQNIEKNILPTCANISCLHKWFWKCRWSLLSVPVSVWHGSVLLTAPTPSFFISFTNTEEFSHPCLVKSMPPRRQSVERALITVKVKHLSALTLSRNGLSGLWNNEVMSFLHTAGKSFRFHTGVAPDTKPALLNAV